MSSKAGLQGLGDPRAQRADSQGAWLSPPAQCPSHGACTQDLCQAGGCEQVQPWCAMRELDHPTAPEVTGPRDQSHTPSTPVLRGHSRREREPPPHFRNNPSRSPVIPVLKIMTQEPCGHGRRQRGRGQARPAHGTDRKGPYVKRAGGGCGTMACGQQARLGDHVLCTPWLPTLCPPRPPVSPASHVPQLSSHHFLLGWFKLGLFCAAQAGRPGVQPAGLSVYVSVPL